MRTHMPSGLAADADSAEYRDMIRKRGCEAGHLANEVAALSFFVVILVHEGLELSREPLSAPRFAAFATVLGAALALGFFTFVRPRRCALPLVLLGLAPFRALGGADLLACLAYLLIGAALLASRRRSGLAGARVVVGLVALGGLSLCLGAAVRGGDPDAWLRSGLALAVYAILVLLAERTRVRPFVESERPVVDLAEKGLSPREREFVLLIAEGLSVKEIAHRVGIEAGSVRTTLGHAYTKLGLKDLKDLTAYLASHEIVNDKPAPKRRGRRRQPRFGLPL